MDDSSERFLEYAVLNLDVFSQGVIDQGLIAPSTGTMDLLPEPVQNISINSYGNPGLSRSRVGHRTLSGIAEIIFLFHMRSFHSLSLVVPI
jgi:hypothetical protein